MEARIPEGLAAAIRSTLDRLDADGIPRRIRERDHTVWSPTPTEISDRLGWLDLAAEGPSDDPELERFVQSLREDGIEDAVVLGMGGSSLGADALVSAFPTCEEGLRVHVLDSTHPSWVRRARRELDPARTVFLVASKSGTTAEVMAFFRYFWKETIQKVGEEQAGRQFAAITDPGTPLARLARERGFRHVFEVRPDVGGRFSVLSRYGLVAAALAGIDVDALQTAARKESDRLLNGDHPAAEIPGVHLGAILGAAAGERRDQLTVLASPGLGSFGLWIEQLVAESTGKGGVGILPVIDEPPGSIERVNHHRLFVGLLDGDEKETTTRDRLAALEAAGHPVLRMELGPREDLAGWMFRWQLATAVAGHVLGVHPFDQPDVESTKRETRRLLEERERTGALPSAASTPTLSEALETRPTYVALLAYVDADEALERAILDLRRELLEERGLTTTFGYGPRYLHSTGQLHKGGPADGLHVQLVDDPGDLPVPEGVGFGPLIAAQAAGDLAALRAAGRRCVRIELGDDAVQEIEALVRELHEPGA